MRPQHDGELKIGWCAGNAVAVNALPRAEVANLGASTPPSSGRRRFPMFWRHLLLPAAIAGPIALAAVIWRRRSKRRHRKPREINDR
jgi:hypothetical protein